MVDAVEHLRNSPLFAGFSEDGLRILASIATPRALDAGVPIFVERMQGESAFLLASGEVSLFVQRGGYERAIGTLQAPDAFGELSLLVPGERRVTVKSRTPVLLVEIQRRDFVRLQQERPQACVKLLMRITERVAQKTAAAAPLLERAFDNA